MLGGGVELGVVGQGPAEHGVRGLERWEFLGQESLVAHPLDHDPTHLGVLFREHVLAGEARGFRRQGHD